MYRCICHTCDEETVLEDFAGAQTLFNDHADRYHEVELVRIEETRSHSKGELTSTETQVDDQTAADE